MAYADWEFYSECFYGDTLTEENAARWLDMASDMLDTLTIGKLVFAYPTIEAHSLRVQKAACAIADALYQIDALQKAAGATKGSDGTYRGAMASLSSGRESISFSTGGSGSSYAAAAASEAEREKLISGIAANYLANIPDANGVNLLYAGV